MTVCFTTDRDLRFGDCDISGTACYPADLKILNGAVEEFWTHIGCPSNEIIWKERWGTPTMHLTCDLSKPARCWYRSRAGAMQDHLAGPSDRPLTFEGPIDLTAGPGAALRRLVMWLVAGADAGTPQTGTGLMARQIESTVLSGLLEARHDHQTQIARLRAARLAAGLPRASGHDPPWGSGAGRGCRAPTPTSSLPRREPG